MWAAAFHPGDGRPPASGTTSVRCSICHATVVARLLPASFYLRMRSCTMTHTLSMAAAGLKGHLDHQFPLSATTTAQAVTGSSGNRVRGSLGSLLEVSAAVVRGSASVAAVITARIDRLRPSQQLTLKVAMSAGRCGVFLCDAIHTHADSARHQCVTWTALKSMLPGRACDTEHGSIAVQVAAAVGMRLPLDLLAAVHPLVDTPAALQGDLRSLAAAQFLRLNAEDGSWAWTQVCSPAVALVDVGSGCELCTCRIKTIAVLPDLVLTLLSGILQFIIPGCRRWRGRWPTSSSRSPSGGGCTRRWRRRRRRR
jgi:hypothetical protein